MAEDLNEDIGMNERDVRAKRETLTTMHDEGINWDHFLIKNLDELMNYLVERQKTGIYLQLLRIVSGSLTNGQGKNGSSKYNYYNKAMK